MTYKIFFFLILMLLNSISVVGKDTEGVFFSFSPKNKTSFIQTVKIRKCKQVEGVGMQEDIVTSISKLQFRRATSGWIVTELPVHNDTKRDGVVVSDPMVDALNRTQFIYTLDDSGRVLDTIGYDDWVEEVMSNVSEGMYEHFSKLMNVESLKSKEMMEWNRKIDGFSGERIMIGDTWNWTVPMTLPSGKVVEYTGQTHIVNWEEVSGVQCVRIEETYTGRAKTNNSDENENVNSTISAEAAPLISGTTIRFVDPKTMLIYFETSHQEIHSEMDLPSLGTVSVVTTEEKVCEYDMAFGN